MVCCCNTIGNVFRLIIVAGCAFALTMQWFNLYSCDFFAFTSTTESIGIWYESAEIIDGNTTCYLDEPYPSVEEPLIRGARSAAVLSMVFGFVAMSLVAVEWICCEICCAGCVEGLAFVGAWACGLGVYMFYGIEECGNLRDDLADDANNTVVNAGIDVLPDGIPTGSNCDWGQGATYNLLACIAYFSCGILLCFSPQPKPLCKESN